MTDPISNERLVGALDNLRVHQRQLDADGCEVGVSREALTEVICAFGELSRRQSPAGVEVKGLEWHGPDFEDEYWAAWDGEKYVIRAETVNGRWLGGVGGYFPSVDAAKAAAQQDFERRILSYLSAKEPEGVELCATDGCDNAATENFEAGGVGSRYCKGCAAKVRALAQRRTKAGTVTDEMVERAAARFVEIEKDETEYSLQEGIRELLTAALSSEPHNG